MIDKKSSSVLPVLRQAAMRQAGSALLLALLVHVPVAHAQAATPAPVPAAPAAEEPAEIVVTGTAIRGVAPVGSATVNLSRAQLVEASSRSASELISNLPQASGIGTALNTTGGRQAGVNLRGLGNNATLLMFDGHRLVPQGVINQVSDPNIIPFAAIQRVEVVTDGASAIYGSDAVAGVVNYILRKDLQGGEISTRFTNTLYNQKTIEGVVGHDWGSGSVMFGFTYEDQNHVPRKKRDYLRQDLRAYGGNDNRFVGTAVVSGAVPNLIVGTTVYGLPATSGVVPTAAQVLPLASQPNLFDTADIYDFFASRKRQSAMLHARQSFWGERAELTYTGIFNRRENAARVQEGFEALQITVTPTSPYYIKGLPNPTANQFIIYDLSLNYPQRNLQQRNKEDSINHTIDLHVDLPADLRLTSYGTWGFTKGCNVCQPQINSTIAAIITASRTDTFNPFIQGAQAGAEDLFAAFLQEGWITITDTAHKIDGPIADLPAGPLRVAVGAEYTKYDFKLVAQNKLNLTNTFQTSRDTRSGRVVKSGFAEVFVPIFGGNYTATGIKRLDLSAAVRYDKYSDFGTTNNPKVGLTWMPINDLTVRASWGTSYRTPTLIESNPQTVGQTNRTNIANGAKDAALPVVVVATGQSPVLSRNGNTAGLRPESAHVWSFGFDAAPAAVPGLKGSVTYYNVDYVDRIDNLPNQALVLSSPENRALYSDFIIVAPQPATCVNGNLSTYNPLYLPYLNNPNTVLSPSTINDCTLVAIVNGGRQNLGKVIQTGIDYTVSYQKQMDIGLMSVGGTFSNLITLKRSLTKLAPIVPAIDTIGNQLSKRGRFNIGWKRGDFTANASANYVGSYLNNATITVAGVRLPDTKVPSWTTLDANFAYAPDESNGILAGTRFSFGIQNFTDKAPPIVLSGAAAIDTNNHNIFGRIWTFEITKKF